MTEKLAEFKSLVGQLMAIIDGDEDAPDDNDKIIEILGKAGRLSDELIKNIKDVPCAEKQTVITNREFVLGLSKHILKTIGHAETDVVE